MVRRVRQCGQSQELELLLGPGLGAKVQPEPVQSCVLPCCKEVFGDRFATTLYMMTERRSCTICGIMRLHSA